MRFKVDLEALRRLLRFGASGILGSLVYWTVYVVLLWAGTGYVIASTAAFGCFLAANFTLQMYWTFGDRGNGRFSPRKFLQYLLFQCSNHAVNLTGLYLLVSLWGLNAILAQAILMLYFLLAGWIVYNTWIFRK